MSMSRLYTVPNDGNCIFHSLYKVFGDELTDIGIDDNFILRTKIVEFGYENHKQIILNLHSMSYGVMKDYNSNHNLSFADFSINNWRDVMSVDTHWGSSLEILLCCLMVKKSIIYVDKSGEENIFCPDYPSNGDKKIISNGEHCFPFC